jgi:hypothetical protein
VVLRLNLGTPNCGTRQVHSLNIGQVGSSYEESHALFLIFLSNIPYV